MKKITLIILALSLLSGCVHHSPSSRPVHLNPAYKNALLSRFLDSVVVDVEHQQRIKEFYNRILETQSAQKPIRLIRYHIAQRYLGQTVNAHKTGLGIMYWPNGTLYIGQWRYDRRNGEGYLLSLSDNRLLVSTYQGQWLNDQIDGQGSLKLANGNHYNGEFVDNKKEGMGAYKWVSGEFSGDSFEGIYNNNLRVGPGTYTWADGSQHTGSWADGLREGEATTTWTNGQRYKGTYKNDKRTGQGVKEWANGVRYEGAFKDGLAHGRGVKSNAKGESCLGIWEQDQLVGECLAGEKL